MKKKIVLAADHAGQALKDAIKDHLIQGGFDVVDVHPSVVEGDDYPEIIRRGCAAVLEYDCMGIVFGGSGNGEAMAANKVPGIRCALAYSVEIAELARKHNDANVLSLGGRFTEPKLALKCVDAFLSTPFEGGRHERRVKDLE